MSRIDVWGYHPDGSVDIMVRDTKEKAIVLDFFDHSRCVVVIQNLEDQMRAFDAAQAEAAINATATWWDSYHNFDETNTWWTQLNAAYPSYTKVGYLATKTAGGRSLQTFEVNIGGKVKPWIYMQCGIHAREWVTQPVCEYVINTLLDGYNNKNADATSILNFFNFAVVTTVNPDGYVYTWQTDRNWRKNRRTNTGSSCVGVDLNRNYNDHWGQGGSSTDPCSDTFRGPSVASENEVRATQTYMQTLQSSAAVWAGIDVHSYSQLVLRPYGWTSANSPNEADQKTLGDRWAAAIKSLTGRTYTSQKSIDLYVTSGTASDYFYGTLSSTNGKLNNQIIHPAGFTVELRPTTSPPGFQLPAAEILPTCQENYAGLVEFFKWFIARNAPLTATT